jgi:hypothetical protein
MNRFKPSLAVLLLCFGLAMLPVEAWLVRKEYQRAMSELGALKQKKLERDRLARHSPAPDTGNATAIAAAVEDVKRKRAKLPEASGGEWVADAPLPDKPVEGYFALTHFGQRMKERAARAKVALLPGERFGFACYVHEGPEAGVLQTVHRQVQIMEYLVGALLDAGPAALLSAKRTAPANLPDGNQAKGSTDYFSLLPELSVGVVGLVDTDAFCLEFTGSTMVLRQFLNTLAQSPRTVIVRTVEAEPMGATLPSRPPAGQEAGSWIRTGRSKFLVTMEVPRLRVAEGTGP